MKFIHSKGEDVLVESQIRVSINLWRATKCETVELIIGGLHVVL